MLELNEETRDQRYYVKLSTFVTRMLWMPSPVLIYTSTLGWPRDIY